MSEKIRFGVAMDVTVAEAVALAAMFRHWDIIADSGIDSVVGMTIAGGKGFKPNCKITTSVPIPELTSSIVEAARTLDAEHIVYAAAGVQHMFNFRAQGTLSPAARGDFAPSAPLTATPPVSTPTFSTLPVEPVSRYLAGEYKIQAQQLFLHMFNIPLGHSNGTVEKLVDAIIGASVQGTLSVLDSGWKPKTSGVSK